MLRSLFADASLPRFGWLYDAGQADDFRSGAKNDICSWCGERTERAAGGAVVCPGCDTR